LLLIPAALPLVLWIQRQSGWRNHDAEPTWAEIAGHWSVWSLLSEAILPLTFHHITGDFLDVLAYAAGAVVAGFWWKFAYRKRSDFDWIAPHYGWMETVAGGFLMQNSRTAFELPASGKVFLVGEGHGRFLEVLLRHSPHLEITYLDQSLKMLEMARGRLRRGGLSDKRVTYLQQDILQARLAVDTYDRVITHYFLDCFQGKQLEAVVSKLALSIKTEGLWQVADFQIPACGWRNWRARIIVWLMIRFFRAAAGLSIHSLENPEPHLSRAGFTRMLHQEFCGSLVYASLWQKRATVSLPRSRISQDS
jgi:ubiquinone/menaquinone biosynthesis C-methylase UbiE